MEIDEMPSYERELLDEEDLMTEMTNELIAVSEEMAKNYNKVRSVDSTFVDNSVIGWEVNHKFRAKNEEGVYKLYTYTYIFNEDCTEIRFSINEASGDYLQIRKQIDDFLSTEDFSSLIASIMAEMEREYYYGN